MQPNQTLSAGAAPTGKQPFKLTKKQEQAIVLFAGAATYILLYGGSRSAKTFTALRTIIWRALAVPNSRHAVVRFRFKHVKESVVLDTFPKVMGLCFPDCPHSLNKSDWYVTFPNGSEIWFGGLDDKERVDNILGKEYATILLNECSQISYSAYTTLQTRLAQKCMYERDGVEHELRLKMFFDENPPNKGHWSYKLFIEGKDPDTNRAVDTLDYAHLQMNPVDNVDNIATPYLKILENLPERKRKRFYEGSFADVNENALWSLEILDESRVNTHPELVRIVVAVDPSGADDDENKSNDDIGIFVAGLGVDGNGYALEDLTINAGPATWGKVTASAYSRHQADRVVGEVNYGGAMVEFVVRTADPNISYKSVTASRGKVVRAEPISALHETGKIKLVGRFDDLEDELLSFTTTGYTGEKSPNRADAYIWAFTELFPGITNKQEEMEPINYPPMSIV